MEVKILFIFNVRFANNLYAIIILYRGGFLVEGGFWGYNIHTVLIFKQQILILVEQFRDILANLIKII